MYCSDSLKMNAEFLRFFFLQKKEKIPSLAPRGLPYETCSDKEDKETLSKIEIPVSNEEKKMESNLREKPRVK